MLFIQTLWTNPVYFFTVCLIVTFSVCLHEYFHAWMGVREGDYTLQDHLTLNPVKQMGFMSLLMMAFFGIAWGGVPVNPTLLRGRWSMLKVSVAGPVARAVLPAAAARLIVVADAVVVRIHIGARCGAASRLSGISPDLRGRKGACGAQG